MDIPSLREPCKFPSAVGYPLPGGRSPGLGILVWSGNALQLGHWRLAAFAHCQGREPGEPRSQKPRMEARKWGKKAGREVREPVRCGAGLPRQMPAQQDSSSNSSRMWGAAAACRGDGPRRRLAAGGISAPAGGSGLATLRCPTRSPGRAFVSVVRRSLGSATELTVPRAANF